MYIYVLYILCWDQPVLPDNTDLGTNMKQCVCCGRSNATRLKPTEPEEIALPQSGSGKSTMPCTRLTCLSHLPAENEHHTTACAAQRKCPAFWWGCLPKKLGLLGWGYIPQSSSPESYCSIAPQTQYYSNAERPAAH